MWLEVSGFYGDRISFWVVFSQSFWLRVLPGGTRLVQPIRMPARRILGGGQTCGVSSWPLPNSSRWWWPISSVFLTSTSCHKTTHANGYYGAWPGWAVAVSVLPLKPVISRYVKYENLNHVFQVPFFINLFGIKLKNHHQQIMFIAYMATELSSI